MRAYWFGAALGVGIVVGWACHEIVEDTVIRVALWAADHGQPLHR